LKQGGLSFAKAPPNGGIYLVKSFKKVFLGAILALSVSALTACTSSSGSNTPGITGRSGQASIADAVQLAQTPATPPPILLIRSDYKVGEVTALCDASIADLTAKLNAIAAVPDAQRMIDNTLIAFETATADFGDQTNQLVFMGSVHRDQGINDEGNKCGEKVGGIMVDVFTRRDLYEAIKPAVTRDDGEAHLKESVVGGFEKNGLKLGDADLKTLKDLLNQISQNQAKFSANLSGDDSKVVFTEDAIKGLPADFVARLTKAADGRYEVVPNEANYPVFMQNATSSDARKAMMLGYLNRGGIENTQLLEKTTVLRAQAAKLLGYASWDDYQLDGRMAESKANVLTFLNSLKDKLALRNKADLDQLLAYKKEIDPAATTLDQWDISWASNQLLKRDYAVDDEKIREYFPADVVIAGMFKVYSQMLGVTYKQVANASVWSPDVNLYEIHNASDDRLIGYFYTDFIPRSLKYDHAAAFQQISGREINGVYNHPVSAIVANLTPPSPGKPSLLSHDDVETIFHEFGHIMHQTLTRAKYASMSGSNVAQDFVEAPSQMLENWVWSPDVLPLLSGHYLDHTQKLPVDMLNKMLAARKFGQGIAYTKQLLYALFDMTIHGGAGETDVTSTYDNLYRKIVGIEPIAGGHFAGTFGHMMGGYDAGYYGYLWSEVYAQDMFTIFQADGLLSPVVGARYRTDILERGGMTDALTNLKDFLGRDPSPDAFFKKLGI
jgi:thimet oligopeptidase